MTEPKMDNCVSPDPVSEEAEVVGRIPKEKIPDSYVDVCPNEGNATIEHEEWPLV